MIKKIAVLFDEFTLGSPAQQLLDRFIIGFPRDGVFQKADPTSVTIWTRNPDNKLLQQRQKDFGLHIVKTPADAVANADGVLVVSAKRDFFGREKSAALNIPVFHYNTGPQSFGAVMSTLQQLPQVTLPKGARIRDALIALPGSESDGFEAIAPILEMQRGGLREIREVRRLAGDEVWAAGGREWSWQLLAAALSRTDKAQGNTVLDGRTEDLVGQGLVQKMAKSPRATIVEHENHSRTTILSLEGVIGDVVAAVQTEGSGLSLGKIYSTQLFQSPGPQQEHFSRLAAMIVDYFETKRLPWSLQRAHVAAELFQNSDRERR